MKCSLSGAGGAELPLPSQVVAGAVLRMAAACITTVGRAGPEACQPRRCCARPTTRCAAR